MKGSEKMNKKENNNYDNIVNEIVNKISSLPKGTETSISMLLENNQYRNEELFEINKEVIKKCNELGLKLNFDKYKNQAVGLPFNIPFIIEETADINMNKKENNVEEYMNKLIDEYEPRELTEEEKEFEKYCKLYEEKFGKKAYIAEPSGSKQQTIDAIKTCLEKNEDLLDKLLYPYRNYDIDQMIQDIDKRLAELEEEEKK